MNARIVVEHNRVHALTDDGIEICGAYQPQGHNYWQLYLSQSVARLTGLRTPPHREHFWDKNNGKADAQAWVEVIAALYVLAAQAKVAAA